MGLFLVLSVEHNFDTFSMWRSRYFGARGLVLREASSLVGTSRSPRRAEASILRIPTSALVWLVPRGLCQPDYQLPTPMSINSPPHIPTLASPIHRPNPPWRNGTHPSFCSLCGGADRPGFDSPIRRGNLTSPREGPLVGIKLASPDFGRGG